MRRPQFRMDESPARALLARAPVIHLAGTDAEGRPVLRVVHGVLVGEHLAFHAAPAGEKLALLGRPVVAEAHEIVAEIPSYFVDPVKACPATTYYESAQVHGVLEEVEDPAWKAEALMALMRRFQPEGGYQPIGATDPLYQKAVAGLLVARLSLAVLDGKRKLGQNRSPEERARILEQLWRRGEPGDPAAVERVRAANPDTPVPAFLAAPAGYSLCCAPGESDVARAIEIYGGEFWCKGMSTEALAAGQRAATAWVGARDGEGRLVATARAISDRVRFAWISDVAVDPAHRGQGLGAAVVRLLLDHPAVRLARDVRLRTRNAAGLYTRFGFVPRGPAVEGRVEMEKTTAPPLSETAPSG